MYDRDVVGYCHLRLPTAVETLPWSRLIPTSKAACVWSQQGLTSCQKTMVLSTTAFHQIKNNFQIQMHCIQCFLKSKYIKSRTFNDKNRWIIKKVLSLKKLLPHLATRGTYSPGDWRCDEAWREQTLVYHLVMCQQRLSYCTSELNVMSGRRWFETPSPSVWRQCNTNNDMIWC